MKKHILLLGGWKTPIEAILNNAHDISYFGTFNSGTLFDISMLKKAIFKQEINLENSALCLYYAKKLHDIKAFDAVVTFNENALNSAIIIKDALKLNKGLDLYPTIVTKNKHLTRNILNSSKLLKLPFITSKNYHDIVDFLKKHKKIVVKPKSGSASQNVVFIDNKRKLKSLMNNINIDNYIVEKYIGTSLLYSVESLSIGGKHSIFSTTVSVLVDNPKYSIQNYIVSPAPLENKTKKIICKCINEFLMQIKLINGVAHTEVKVENDKAYIIESQTRIGGDKIYKSVSLTTSYCQINEYFKYLFNPKKFKTHKILPSNCITCYACILFKKGKIETLDTSKLSKINEIIEYNIVAKEGDLIKTMKDNTKRGGFVYFKVDNYKDIDIVLDKIKQAIHVVYDDKTIYKINFEKFL